MSNNQVCSAYKSQIVEIIATSEDSIEDVKRQANEKLRSFAETSENHPALREYIRTAHSILLSDNAKRVRSLLPVLIADARGFDRDTCFKYGITIELLHYSSLIHDDVIDGDMMRRGYSTLNDLFTNSHAVLIGDFMMCSVIDFALQFNHSTVVIKLMVGAIKKLVTGLVIEQKVLPEKRSLDSYLEMASLKTGALFQLSFGLPFVAHEHLDKALECGRIFGVLFQIYDDYFDKEKDDQYQNIFHMLSEKEVVEVWNENFFIFSELVKFLDIEKVLDDLLAYLKKRKFFIEVSTDGGVLFEM